MKESDWERCTHRFGNIGGKIDITRKPSVRCDNPSYRYFMASFETRQNFYYGTCRSHPGSRRGMKDAELTREEIVVVSIMES